MYDDAVWESNNTDDKDVPTSSLANQYDTSYSNVELEDGKGYFNEFVVELDDDDDKIMNIKMIMMKIQMMKIVMLMIILMKKKEIIMDVALVMMGKMRRIFMIMLKVKGMKKIGVVMERTRRI